MTMDAELKKIERNAILTYFQDGLWDILLGIFLLAWGVGILTDSAALTGVWFLPAYWIAWSLKRRLIHPRIGYVKIEREKRTLSWLAVAGVVAFFLGITAYFLFTSGAADFLYGYYMLIFGAIVASVASAVAYWWLVKRWYIYAVLIMLGVSSHQWLDFSLPFSFIIPGSLIAVSGLAVLTWFLRRNPKAVLEGADDSR